MKERTEFHKAYGTEWSAVPKFLIRHENFPKARECISMFQDNEEGDVGYEPGDRDPDIEQALVVIAMLLDYINTGYTG